MAETLQHNDDGDPLQRGFGTLVERYVNMANTPAMALGEDDVRFIGAMDYIFGKIAEVHTEGR